MTLVESNKYLFKPLIKQTDLYVL